MADKGYKKAYCPKCQQKMKRAWVIGTKGWTCTCGFFTNMHYSELHRQRQDDPATIKEKMDEKSARNDDLPRKPGAVGCHN